MIPGLDSAVFTFDVEGQRPGALRVYRLSGNEQISQLFRFDVTLVAESAHIDLMAQIGAQATLSLRGIPQIGGGYLRRIYGRIERFEQLSAGKRYSQYQATLSPSVFPLGYTRNSRVFRELSTPAIVERVLTDGHYPTEQLQVLLHSSYGPRDFCVQYQESDLAFICRLLEEEGIFFFFRHDDGKDILVLGDGSHAIESVPQASHLAYRDQPHLYEEVVHGLRAEARFRPGSTVLRDFRFKHPALDMEAHQSAADFKDYQVYYFPGEYVDPDLGKRLAKIRLEEIQCDRSQVAAESNCPALLPGHTFHLEGHWRPDMSRGYLLTAIEHEGVQPQVLGEEHVAVTEPQYKNRLFCIPDDVPYRAPRRTPRPCILGVQSAVVVGPAGEEIHCDEHGRIKVQFHWDRQSQKDDASSCWIRVSQPWGGAGYGGMFIPRVGQEVLVQFLEGDPDRPVIVGRVYNGEHRVPYSLPNNKSTSVVRTSTTPGGDGFNELRFEDAAGHEEIYIHAQRDLNQKIRNNHTICVNHNQSIEVKLNRQILVHGREEHTVSLSRETTITDNDSSTINGNYRIAVHGESGIIANADTHISLCAGETLTMSCGQSKIVLLPEQIMIESPKIRINGGLVKINCSD